MAMLEVHGLDVAVAMLALLQELRAGGFFHSLSERYPRDLAELMSHFEKYFNTEKGMAKKKEGQGNASALGRAVILFPLDPGSRAIR